MIWMVMMISLKRLIHNRVEWMLALLVPIAFFSIFALIFGGSVGSGSTPKIKVVAVDTICDDHSKRIIAALHQTIGLHFVAGADDRSDGSELHPLEQLPELSHEARAIGMVRRGTVSMAIVLRRADGRVKVELLSDASDQVAPQLVAALVQRALMSASNSHDPGIAPQAALADPRHFSPATSAPAAAAMADAAAAAAAPTSGGVVQASGAVLANNSPAMLRSPAVEIIDVLGAGKSNPVVTMYAAGIAVMFLLFGATGGGGALLEERENQTLDRLLTTGLSMNQLLLGKWGYLTLLGITQTTLMFLWGQAVFGIDLLGHLDGFFAMTLVTAGAAAAFGLLLATFCRTRGQLNGLAVVAVLSMSALGGSMVPRYVMSQSLRDAGLWTFNAWALDGYDKVFWRDMPVVALWPQLSVLMLSGAAFLLAARVMAIRWETQ